MKQILHIVTDEKFTDYAIRQFSAPEMHSEFICLNTAGRIELVNLRNKVPVISPYTKDFTDFLNSIAQYKAIVLHGMHWGRWQRQILERVPDNIKVAWVFWGGEIYGRSDINISKYAPITKVLSFVHTKKKGKKDTAWELPLDLYKRVDYCWTDEKEEYEFVKNFTGASFEYLWYNYYALEDTIGQLMTKRSEGRNIWIGNSASESNNHCDVIWLLWKRGLLRQMKDKKVIIPLSYGALWIRNLVSKIGRFVFGKRMRALDTFLPRDEYNALMLTCSTMIIGYYEPAAQGNIITALWLGMRVFVSERNITYRYFKRIGCKIYSIEKDLISSNLDVFAPMKEEDVVHNRDILYATYSQERTMSGIKTIVETLLK